MVRKSAYQDIQNILYSHFSGEEDTRIRAFLYVLSVENPQIYQMLEMRFKHKKKMSQIVQAMNVENERAIQKRLQKTFIRLKRYL